MDRNTMEIISAVYTAYTLLNPANRVVVPVDSFAESFNANLELLENTRKAREAEPAGGQNMEAKAEAALEKGLKDAEETLGSKDRLSSLLQKLKQKMKSLPMAGSAMANVPTMFRLLNSYLKDEYTDIPQKKLLQIVSALSYLVAPIDLIPDFIPVVGLLDDLAVIAVCTKSTKAELEKYLAWREANGLVDTEEENE